LARVTGQLRGLFAGGGLAELSDHVGKALPDNRVHFGYKDGIAQPNIDGSSAEVSPDMQPVAPTGEFLLGYPSQWKDFAYPVPQPRALGVNGSFAVFGILKQDVVAFEQFLQTQAATTGMSTELLAAKLLGRWRNGVPLVLSPTSDAPLAPEQ